MNTVGARAGARHAVRGGRPRRRFLAALVAMLGMLAIAAHPHVAEPVSHAAHPHVLASPLGGEFSLDADHPHFEKDASGAHHEPFPRATPARSTTAAPAALGPVAAPLAAAAAPDRLSAPVGRGPPGMSPRALSGQDLLVRLSISRR